MKRTPVESTMLASIGYDEAKGVLEIEFQSGSLYQYRNVPQEVFEELRAASSKGQYFLENLRDAGYPYRRLR